MWFHSFLATLNQTLPRPAGRHGPRRRTTFRPQVQVLEDRTAPVVNAAASFPQAVEPGRFDGVVQVRSPNASGTGTLLWTGRHILTAAHVVDFDVDTSVPTDGAMDRGNGAVDAGTHRVIFDMPGGPITIQVPAADITIHPRWTGTVAGLAGDIAIIRLPELAPGGASEGFQLYRSTQEKGQVISFLGYGATNRTDALGNVLSGNNGQSNNAPAQSTAYGTKRIGSNRVDWVPGTEQGNTDPFDDQLSFDLDDPASRDDRGVSGEALSAEGDSGGPMLIGGSLIAGVCSTGTRVTVFGGVANYVRVSSYAGWIDTTVGGNYNLVLHMNHQPGGNDGRPDRILVQERRFLQQNYLEVFVNDQLVHFGVSRRVLGVQIIGSNDHDTITIDARQSGLGRSLHINAGLGNDTINIESLPADVDAFLDGDYGDDTFNIAPVSGDLDNIRGSVVIDGGTFFEDDNLYVNDSRNTGPGRRSIVRANSVTMPGPAARQIAFRRIDVLVVDAGRSADSTVNVYSTGPRTTVAGAAFVNVGQPRLFVPNPGRTTENVSGLSLVNLFGTTALTIDDSAGRASRVIGVHPTTVTGLTTTPIDFAFCNLSSLTVKGGALGNDVTVHGTRQSGGPVTIDTGLGKDVVRVLRAGVPVNINGQDGEDEVHVGESGSMRTIAATLTISNDDDWSTVNLDNSKELLPGTVTLDTGGIYATVGGLAARGLIRIAEQDLRALNIFSGGGTDTFEVRDTAQSTIPGGSPTTIYTTLFDTVNVHGTTGPLFLDLQGGRNQVTVGGRANESGSLSRIAGDVTLRGQAGAPGSFLDLLDQTTTGQHTYSLSAGQFSRTRQSDGVTSSRVHFAGAPLSRLSLRGGRSANRYLIDGTPTTLPSPNEGGVSVTAGPAADSLTLLGTGGDLDVDLGPGRNQQVAVGDATHALAALSGKITISAASPVVARVTNEAASSDEYHHTVDRLGAGASLARFALRGGVYVPMTELDFPTISLLDFQHGRTHQQPTNVSGTPAGMTLNVRGAAGSTDIFTAGWSVTGVNNLLGPVNFYGQAEDNDYTYYYDYTTTAPHTYTIQADPTTPTAQRIERDGVAPFTYHGGLILFSTARVGGNTVHVKSVPANIYLNMTFAQGDDVTIGSAASGAGGSLAEVRGPMSIQAYGRASVVLDNSGNLDTTPRRVTFSRQVSGGVSYNLIEGLTGSTITWYTDDATTIAVRGGAADDTFSVKGVTTPGVLKLDGGGGVNTLDYSGFDPAQSATGGVAVNLRRGTATALGGIANIRNVIGSAGNDILVGVGGNELSGGAGRDLLIAGAVASLLRGGDGDDLHTAGPTATDADQAALQAILDEWASASDYLTRLAHLRAGLLAEGRVTSNGAANDLKGEGDRDLFFASISRDILGKADDETVIPI
ncbi:MAG: trypsin-like serine protease [Gemmataceae bacterium]